MNEPACRPALRGRLLGRPREFCEEGEGQDDPKMRDKGGKNFRRVY